MRKEGEGGKEQHYVIWRGGGKCEREWRGVRLGRRSVLCVWPRVPSERRGAIREVESRERGGVTLERRGTIREEGCRWRQGVLLERRGTRGMVPSVRRVAVPLERRGTAREEGLLRGMIYTLMNDWSNVKVAGKQNVKEKFRVCAVCGTCCAHRDIFSKNATKMQNLKSEG